MDTSDYFSKIPQSVLISGTNLETLSSFVENWSTKLLQTEIEQLKRHPDFYVIHPQNKMRQISVDALRELKKNVYTTSQRGGRKVFVIYEADRLNTAAANALLKTLEEPTDSSSVFLVTLRPYDMLPTLRSRCWWIQLNQGSIETHDADFEKWLDDFREFLLHLTIEAQKVSVLNAYGLLYRMQNYMTQKLANINIQKNEQLSEEETSAQTAQAEKQIIQSVFQSIELVCGDLAKTYPEFRHSYPNMIQTLERCFSRTEVNFGTIPALETFLLSLYTSKSE